jgi:hypothetical protein
MSSPTGKLHSPSRGAVAPRSEKQPASTPAASPAVRPSAASAREEARTDQRTTTSPLMKGWGVQWKGKVPGREKVIARRSPTSIGPESKLPSSAVTL